MPKGKYGKYLTLPTKGSGKFDSRMTTGIGSAMAPLKKGKAMRGDTGKKKSMGGY